MSKLAQLRDDRLLGATAKRDQRLRALPTAAKLYEAFDQQVEDGRGKQLATDARAEAARAAALQQNSDSLGEALNDAHLTRREADVIASEKRKKAEDDAEREFMIALTTSVSKPSTDAQRIRAEKLDKAKKEFDAALAAAQEQFRQARDAALVAESRASRDADRALAAAMRISDASSRAARATAEQALAKALAALPDASGEISSWKKETAAIVADYKRAENQEFERFHDEMEALRR